MPEYKQTEIGWIPRDWEVIKFREVFSYIKGKKPVELIDEYKENYLPYLSTEYLRENKATKFARISEDVISINKGDLILLWDGSNAGEFFVGKEGILSSTMVKLQLKKENIDLGFVFYLLKIKEYYLSRLTRGTGIPHVDKNVLENLTLTLPSLPEQQKIAEILSTVDQAIEKAEEAMAKTVRLKKGLMQELLTKGIGHKEFKDTEIGKIPKEWKVMRLGEIIKVCQYGLSVKIKEKGKYPIIKMDDIVNGYVITDNIKYTDIDDKTFEIFKLKKGDILFNRTNSYELVGRTGIFLLDGNYVFASYLIRLRPIHEIVNSYFLTFYLVFKNNKIRHLATRAVHQANINATNLQKFKLPLPPLPEQQKIAEILSPVDKRLELLRNKKEKLERIKKGLMNDLLTGKRRAWRMKEGE